MEELIIKASTSENELYENAIKNISALISNKSATLLKLVELLGAILTSDDPYKRGKGIDILASVTALTPRTLISGNESSILLSFFLERLGDKVSVEGALKGTLALLKAKVVAKSEMLKIPQKIFSELDVQSHNQHIRYTVYQIFEAILEVNLQGVKSLGSDFVFGFIQAMDSEKDPRNLMICFKLVVIIAKELDIGKYAEDLFDTIFCYFPITFRPPPDDVYGITAADLKFSLRSALASSQLLGQFAMPSMVEKLTSTSRNAKESAIDAIAACAPVYGSSVLFPHLEELWDYIKDEIIEDQETDLVQISISALCAVTKTLSNVTASKTENGLNIFLERISKDVRQVLDGSLELIAKYAKIVKFVGSVTDPALSHFSEMIPSLMSSLTQGSLIILLALLNANRDLYRDRMDIDGVESPLSSHVQGIFNAVKSVLEGDTDVRGGLCVKILVEILSLRVSTSNETEESIKLLCKIAISDLALNLEAQEGLLTLSGVIPDQMKTYSLEYLFSRLKDDFKSAKETKVLESLEKLLPVDSLFQSGVEQLFAITKEVFLDSTKVSQTLQSLQSLSKIVASRSKVESTSAARLLKNSVITITYSLIDLSLAGVKSPGNVVTSDNALVYISDILRIATRSFEVTEQKELATRLYLNFTKSPAIAPMKASSDAKFLKFMLLLKSVLSSIRPEVELEFANNVIKELLVESQKSSNDQFVYSCAVIIGSMLNKKKDDTEITALIKDFINNPEPGRRSYVVVYTWICKGLITRSHALGSEMLVKMMEWMKLNDWQDVVDGIGMLIEDRDELNKESFANMKLLYKQKFFETALKLLITEYEKADESLKFRYLIAISKILQHIQKSVFISRLEFLLPYMLTSLEIRDQPDLVMNMLNALSIAIVESPEVLSKKIDVLMESLLDSLSAGNMTFRIKVLTTLSLITQQIQYELLHGHKSNVVKRLTACLDDPKRLLLVFIDLVIALITSCTPADQETACAPAVYPSPATETFSQVTLWMSVSILFTFCVEIIISLYAFGYKHLKSVVNGVDAVVVFASLFLELYFHFSGLESSAAGALVILRIWKIVRAMHAIAHAVQIKNNKIIASIKAVNDKFQAEEKIIHTLFETKHQEMKSITKTIRSTVDEDKLPMIDEMEKIFDILDRALKREEGILDEFVTETIKNVRDPDDPDDDDDVDDLELHKEDTLIPVDVVIHEREGKKSDAVKKDSKDEEIVLVKKD
ncbi:mms19 nucleotide excision repair [Nowakowskiella sp. JEL0407]|nr:mms19 nucleotide excision repair [Nowakowskiella sp. JEL0407]